MKIHTEIVTGFLGAGKTSFINSLLEESHIEWEKVLVFQLEHGQNSILPSTNKNKVLIVKKIYELNDLKDKMITSIKKYNPNRIIIEFNGTSEIKELFNILNQKNLKECCKITTIFFVADGRTLNQYMDNIGGFMVPFIQNANMIVVNNAELSKKDELIAGMKKIKSINSRAYILKVNNKYILKSMLREAKVIDNGYLKKMRIKFINYNKKCGGSYKRDEKL